MIVRMSWLGLVGVTLALAQGPKGGPGHLGPGAGPEARFLGAEMGRPGRVVKNAPFSADVVTESTQTLANGDHIKQTGTARFLRDSEGRTRREQSLNGLGALTGNASLPRTVVFIDDPVGGTSYALNPADKTATKSMRPARSGVDGRGGRWEQTAPQSPRPDRPFTGRGRGAMNNPNIKTESLGTQTMEGVQAQGTRTTMTIPAGRMGNEQPILIVTERWYSADLQTTLLVKHSDPRNGETVTRYTNISRAEPAQASFQVPGDYQVRAGGRGAGSPQ